MRRIIKRKTISRYLYLTGVGWLVFSLILGIGI